MRPVALLVLFALSYGKADAASKMTPVTRVVELMQGLSKQIEAEGKQEEDLYEKYVCWAKTIIDAKTNSNAEAKARVTELEERIAEIKANPQTSEEKDLTKKLGELKDSKQENLEMFEQQTADFEKARQEFTLALDALDSAIQTLKEGTKEKKTDTNETDTNETVEFLAIQAGFQARVEQSANLDRAVEIGNRYLAKGDALFLQRLLTGAVPKKDWKKLNRKSTYNQKYKARSTKIQDLLQKLRQTFRANLAEANAKQEADKAAYKKRNKELKQQITETEKAKTELKGEGAAKAMNEKECQDEIDILTINIKNDERFIKQTVTQLEEMKSEWKSRQTVRADELAAIAEAIEILSNDDAKDTFSASFTSQGYLFLQTEQTNSVKKALAVLRETAKLSGNAHLLEEPQACIPKEGETVSTDQSILCVVGHIDNMLRDLAAENKKDLAQKEHCEKLEMVQGRKAAVAARDADDETDTIAQKVAEMAECDANIQKANETIEAAKVERTAAIRLRKDQNTEWTNNDGDDTAAAALVEKAKGVLEKFYSNPSKGALPEGEFVQEPPKVVAGEAPPPPPSTWKDPTYEGKQEANVGIVAILAMIKEDILKDQKEAKAAELKQEQEHQAFLRETADLIRDQGKIILKQKGLKSSADGAKTIADGNRNNDHGDLKLAMRILEDNRVGCTYISLNFPLRKKNRDIEMDGLRKAKAILTGAKFDAPDPNREIKPGDAFLQRHKF